MNDESLIKEFAEFFQLSLEPGTDEFLQPDNIIK
jgi:hypothetical protein